MLERSVAGFRPQLDLFFANLRAALDAAAGGADRRRLEEFQVQAAGLQDRLYACLDRDERTDLVAIARDLQVLAYRIRVLFGRPLAGVAWEDFQTLIADMPRAAAYTSADLRGPREAASFDARTLVGRQATTGGGLLSERAHAVVARTGTEALPVTGAEALRSTGAEARPTDPAETAESPPHDALAPSGGPVVPEDPLLPALLVDPEPAEAAPAPEAAAASGWDFPFGAILVSCAIFLAGAGAGSVLGGVWPPLTALACGIAALAAMRPLPSPVAV